MRTATILQGPPKNIFRFFSSIAFLSACFSSGSICKGQVTVESRPATTNVDGAEYPRLNSDLSVEFRLSAPTAQKVQVQVLGATLDMVR